LVLPRRRRRRRQRLRRGHRPALLLLHVALLQHGVDRHTHRNEPDARPRPGEKSALIR
jgi:hypothetical protein